MRVAAARYAISFALIGVMCLLVASPRAAQATEAADSTMSCTPTQKTVRRVAVGGTFVAANVALQQYFKKAWWSGEKRDFWTNHDWRQPFREHDKAGHMYGGFHITRYGTDLLVFACVPRSKAVWYAASYAAAYQLQIELWDAKQAMYGFSPPDLIFNTLGAALGVATSRREDGSSLRPAMSYHKSKARKLGVGINRDMRLTTDYTGQTYWMSVNPRNVLNEQAGRMWPKMLRVSAGYGITNWRDPYTAENRFAHRKFLLSVDLDPEQLPGSHPVLKRIKREMSYYRFPAPALQLTPSFKGVKWYR